MAAICGAKCHRGGGCPGDVDSLLRLNSLCSGDADGSLHEDDQQALTLREQEALQDILEGIQVQQDAFDWHSCTTLLRMPARFQ